MRYLQYGLISMNYSGKLAEPTKRLLTSAGRCAIHLTLMITSTQVVETSVNVSTKSPCQDYTHPDDHILHQIMKRLRL